VFRWLGRLFGRRTAVEMQRDNPVLDEAVRRSAEAYAELPLKNLIDEARRSTLARALYLEISRICNTVDPVTTCREELAATMLKSAGFQVLVIPPPPEDDESGFRRQPGVTGELKAHIADICAKNDDMRSAMYAETDEEDMAALWPIIERLHWETRWLLETLNATRIALGDHVEGDDWYLPFLHAACVQLEHTYRWELELPPAFDEGIAREAAATYAVFSDIVLSGAANPAAEWRDYARSMGVPLPDFSS
jgi:hypothetical protein